MLEPTSAVVTIGGGIASSMRGVTTNIPYFYYWKCKTAAAVTVWGHSGRSI